MKSNTIIMALKFQISAGKEIIGVCGGRFDFGVQFWQLYNVT